MEVDPKALDAAVDTFYQAQVNAARERFEKVDFDPQDIQEFVEKLLNESETAQILIFYSYLDDRIKTLITLQMEHLDNANDRDRLFGINGPMNTFNSRTLLAYHFGWLSPEQKRRLDAFRRIRNEFAHRAFRITISDPKIAQDLTVINYDMQTRLDLTGYDFSRANLTLCNLIMPSLRTFRDLIVLPVAKAFHVNPNDISPSHDDQPELLKRISRSLMTSFLTVGAVPSSPHH